MTRVAVVVKKGRQNGLPDRQMEPWTKMRASYPGGLTLTPYQFVFLKSRVTPTWLAGLGNICSAKDATAASKLVV